MERIGLYDRTHSACGSQQLLPLPAFTISRFPRAHVSITSTRAMAIESLCYVEI